MELYTALNLVVFCALLFLIYRLSSKSQSLSRRVFTGLVLGLIYGFALQLLYGTGTGVMNETLNWTNLVGDIYVRLLRMIIMPLILVTMIASVLKMDAIASVGKIGVSIVGMLVLTTAIAALIGIGITLITGLSAEGMVAGARELARADVLEMRRGTVSGLTLPDVIASFVPTNIFNDLTEARDNSIIAVVIFGILSGIAALLVSKDNPEQGATIKSFVDAVQAVVMKLVRMVMGLTPYGILALMTYVVASSDADDILNLISFVLASYTAILIMFGVHSLFIMGTGMNVRAYFQKIWPVLSFAFATRSSAATIPLTVRAQVEELKVPAPVANLAASFGATIGQNGCAGIYPAMLAVMVAPTVNVDPTAPMFILSLVAIIAISSFGVAGVGGGATFAALIVLSAMDLPITVVALLISIEPLIDMARTALNVNGAITSGVVTTKMLGMQTESAAPMMAESAA
ncbi:MAG: cation:dicarboxylase symporter family transporter [Pseudomonadales bacterium]|nr:cation:dicarboxylase symporter family transporter [Pseudomonadales bacterium]MCP5330479.1 cation:dicarboxylase symporter family transporter [Pseudomonadales bacterium]MCP5345032.1 cation:dicarboxylase symporter family transporter [Pseudomonadales bacterium]